MCLKRLGPGPCVLLCGFRVWLLNLGLLLLEDSWAPWQSRFETGVEHDIGVPGSAFQLVVGGSLQLCSLAPPSLLGDISSFSWEPALLVPLSDSPFDFGRDTRILQLDCHGHNPDGGLNVLVAAPTAMSLSSCVMHVPG